MFYEHYDCNLIIKVRYMNKPNEGIMSSVFRDISQSKGQSHVNSEIKVYQEPILEETLRRKDEVEE